MITDYINNSEANGIKGLCRQHELEAMFEEWEIEDAIKNGIIYSPRPGFYKVIEAWEPTHKDVQWLVNLLDMLKVGGVWIWPSYGVIVNKTDENTLTLRQPFVPTAEATEMIRRTKKVAEKAGIHMDEAETVDPTFKQPEFFIMHHEKTPPSSEEIGKSYECESCGASIAQGEERRMKDGETILCPKCAKQHPDDYFL